MSDNPDQHRLKSAWARITTPLWEGVIPEAYGLALAATLIVGLVGASLCASHAVSRQTDALAAESVRGTARVLASALQASAQRDPQERVALLGKLCESSGAAFARWTAADGTLRAEWRPKSPKASLGDTTHEASIQVLEPDGVQAGTLRLGMALHETQATRRALLWGNATVAGLALLLFLRIYWKLHRHVRPIHAVRRNLTELARGVENDLQGLSLSDSLGEVAAGWNQLIEELVRLRGDGDAAQDKGDAARTVFDRFETRTMRQVLDRLPIGVLRVGLNQCCTFANRAALQFLEQSEETLRATPVSETLGEEVIALLSKENKSPSPSSFDRHSGPDDGGVTLRFTVYPAQQEMAGGERLLTIEDVSFRYEAERSRDRFLYHVTHELRTPLTNIQAYAETLAKPAFDDEQTRRECYNVIISETRRLSALVENILSISQLEVGSARVEMGEVDLVRVLRQMVEDNQGVADEKSIDLTLKLPPKTPKIEGDKQRLSILLNNLIGNAVKYTPEQGRVNVILEVEPQYVRITVSDTGIGIDSAEHERVFEKFYRAADSKIQAVTGTGLGLAIARETARLHGGDIHLESEPGKGSTFVVELPLSKSSGVEVEQR